MRKLTQLINENLSEQTWSQVIGDGSDIDFVNCGPDVEEGENFETWWSWPSRKLGREKKVNAQISIYEIGEFILVCKNNDPLAMMSVYEMHGWAVFKTMVIMYGHEEILIYDTDDFTHKKIYTR